MKVLKTLAAVSIGFMLVVVLFGFPMVCRERTILGSNESSGSSGSITTESQTVGGLEIIGDVKTPLNLTYADLFSLPMVSEVAELKCVEGTPDVIYNWTGVPLFYLLTLAQIKPDAYKIEEVCSDGYTSDLFMSDALKPTTILALGSNGTGLPQLTYGPAGPNRLAVPGKLGYKWASGIQEIIVTTTDYRGQYEIDGYSDEADVPNYGPLPTPVPAIQTLELPLGNRVYQVGAFTNASKVTSALDAPRKMVNVNFSSPAGASVFADLILQLDFLKGPFNVTVDGLLVNATEADTNSTSYIYLDLSGGSHTVSILGSYLIDVPEAVVYPLPRAVNVGQNVTFDASQSQDIGRIVSYEWDFGDGTNGSGSVVVHSYNREGTYNVQLNLTNNQGLSSLDSLTIVVSSPLDLLVLFLRIFLIVMVIALVSIFAFLLRRRKTRAVTKQNQEK